ncbi:protocadherin Fat 3-like [Panulirus ornatus]|uniref:protocadherin Fat 3-like n=1 Tax=Panulirus ornatus TaxID=150431 RepID=UPI003A89AAEE
MAVNVLVPLLIPLGEQLTNVTKLVGSGPVEFESPEYLVEARENTRTPLHLVQLTARTQPQAAPVEFRISEGNEGGAFSLDPATGRLSLVVPLDYEEQQQVRQGRQEVMRGQRVRKFDGSLQDFIKLDGLLHNYESQREIQGLKDLTQSQEHLSEIYELLKQLD